MPRASRASVSIPVLASLLVPLASGACGRTGLDLGGDVAGGASGAGSGQAGVGAAGMGDAACMPGVSRCVADNVLAVCDASGTRETITMCAGACVNGACVVLRNLVFVTSQAFVGGALGGLDGADDACTELAASAGISSRAFAAWLSDAQGSPSTRFARRDGPYALVDGTVVANDWIELTSGTLRHSIDLTELGGPPPQGTVGCVSPAVWSGTNDDGTQAEVKLGADCGDWNNPIAETAVFGWVGHTTRWSNACTLISGTPAKSCGGTAALYCFEQ